MQKHSATTISVKIICALALVAGMIHLAGADEKTKPLLQRLRSFQVVRPSRLSLQGFENEDGFIMHPDQHTFHFEALGKTFTIDLTKNEELFTPGYRSLVYNGDTLVSEEHPDTNATNCHYTGRVRADPNSRVAISTCFGLYGVIFAFDDIFYIQASEDYMKKDHPLELAATAHHTDHYVYRVQDLSTNPSTCAHASNLPDPKNQHGYGHRDRYNRSNHRGEHDGDHGRDRNVHSHSHHDHDHDQHDDNEDGVPGLHPAFQLSALLPRLQNASASLQAANPNNMMYTEMLVVNDVRKLAIWNNNVQNCEAHSASIVNQVGLIYKNNMLNPAVTVMLKTMVTWQGSDPFTPSRNSAGEANSDDLLSKFSDWRVSAGNSIESDASHLFSGWDFDGSTVGLAYLGTMCEKGSATGVDEIRDTSGYFDVTLVAHELGHNFGMPHDGSGASSSCPKTYVMSPVITSVNPSTFSTCSKAAYSSWYNGATAQAQCLTNVPTGSFKPTCGNGFVDEGETCDCGSSDCSAIDPCCNGRTCQLNAGATCSNAFPCCQNCQLVPASANKVCRPSVGACDLADKCNGVDMNCPADTFQPSGTPCNDGFSSNGGVCYRAACVSQAKQCKSLESSYGGSPIVPCSYRNKCRDLLCGLRGDVDDCYFFWGAGSTHIQENDGMSCGTGQQCLGGQCVPSSTLDPSPSFSWSTAAFGSCSASCGGGVQTRSVTCISSSGSTVSDSFCSGSKPATQQSCNTASCPTYAWQQGSFGSCSASCGGGVQSRSVTCQQNGGSTVSDSFCSGSKPATQQACSTAACPTYAWQQGGFGSCSASCGGGVQTQTVTCKQNGGSTVSDSFCSGSKPATQQSCNTASCPTYSWQQGGFGTCSASCGGGVQSQTVTCRQNGGSTVSDSFCSGSKPATQQSCNTASCPTYSWQQGSFGSCSASCGGGVQSRSVTCRQNGGSTVADSFCSGSKPATQQACNTATCPTYAWQQSGFGSCSASCGGGVQTQTVTCKQNGGSTVSDSFCSGSKPATQQSCNTVSCPSYAWQQGGFGTCSASCGGGVQSRTVTCQQNGGSTVSDSFCSGSKPATQQSCNTAACPTYAWQQSGFGTCSASCGGGVQTQTVTCKQNGGSTVSDSFCSGSKPATQQACNTAACPTYSWQQSGFGTCSASCGGGVQSRSVTCQQNGGSTVSDSFCSGSKPATQQSCNTASCPTYAWQQGGFGSCSASCGGGVQTQTVTCKQNGGSTVSDSFCSGSKPATQQSCNTASCPTYAWQQGGFGSCSASCGGGVQTQTVTCKQNGGSTVSDSFCSGSKPATQQSCNTAACPTYAWQQSGFGSCSASCGGGVQTQTVTCKQNGGSTVSDSFCSGSKPATQQSCNTASCPTYAWQQGGFGSCSASCGGGVQSQSVTCKQNGGSTVSDSFCSGSKPATQRACNTAACPSYSWQQGSFGSCSASCGGGVQSRSVTCRQNGGSTVSDSFCSGSKPATQQACNTQTCANSRGTWQRGSWSSCSKSCGIGVSTRTVTCVRNREVVADSFCSGLKPPSTTVCNLLPCPRYTWRALPWGKCSAHCGGGMQTRLVKCMWTIFVVPDKFCSSMEAPAARQACNMRRC